jgi:hypothetical protein
MRTSKWLLIWIQAAIAICCSVITAFPQNIQLVGTCPIPGGAFTRSIYVDDGYAYLTEVDSHFFIIINISDPVNPTIIAETHTMNAPSDIVVDSGYAYITDAERYLNIFNVSDPLDPHQVSQVETGYLIHRLCKRKDMVYLANCTTELNIIDVSNPLAPHIEGTWDSTYGESQGVAVQGSYAYMADWQDGFYIIFIGNPSAPQFVSDLPFPHDAPQDIRVFQNYAYVMVSDESRYSQFRGIKTIDISDPQNPEVIGSYSITNGYCRNIFLKAPYLLVAHNSLSIFDISDPAYLQLVGSYTDPNNHRYIKDVFYRDNYIYAITDSSMIILYFEPSAVEDDLPGKPDEIDLLFSNPNPFNTQTTIEYALTSSERATLEIYDTQGRKVSTLVDGQVSPGKHKLIWDAGKYASGIYFAKLNSIKGSKTIKLILLK